MVDFHRENHDDSKFEVSLIERPDGWGCLVQRGGNVTLATAGFKNQTAASYWALKAVTAILRLDIERTFDKTLDSAAMLEDCKQGLAVVMASLNVKKAPQDVPCQHCGHGADEHDPTEGHCTGGCPCTLFVAAVLR